MNLKSSGLGVLVGVATAFASDMLTKNVGLMRAKWWVTPLVQAGVGVGLNAMGKTQTGTGLCAIAGYSGYLNQRAAAASSAANAEAQGLMNRLPGQAYPRMAAGTTVPIGHETAGVRAA